MNWWCLLASVEAANHHSLLTPFITRDSAVIWKVLVLMQDSLWEIWKGLMWIKLPVCRQSLLLSKKRPTKTPGQQLERLRNCMIFCVYYMQELVRLIVTIRENPWLSFPKQKSFKILPHSLRIKKLIYWRRWYVVEKDIIVSYLKKLERKDF